MYLAAKRFIAQGVLKSPVYRFLAIFLGLYLFLHTFHWAFEGIVTPRNYYNAFIDQHFNYLRWFSTVLLTCTKGLITLLGFPSFVHDNWLRIPGHGGVIVAYPCLGFQLMNFFTAFALAFPRPLKSRLIFLFTGLLCIQVLNMLRFIYLCLYWEGSFLGFTDHHDAFNFVIYLLIFVMLLVYVKWGEAGSRKQEVKG